MATFKCKLSGETVSFEYEHDIEGMRNHPGYEEIVETAEVVEEPVTPSKKTRNKTVTSVGN